MTKSNSASCGRTSVNPAAKMAIGSIDLDTVPGVKAHFAHIRGASNTDKIMSDPGLRSRADEIVSAYETLVSDGSPQSHDQLRQCGLTIAEVALMRQVVDQPHLWNRSQVDGPELFTALARYSIKTGSRTTNKASYQRALTRVRAIFASSSFWAVKPNPLSEGEIPFQGRKSSGFPLMSKKETDEVRGLKEASRLVRTQRRCPPCVAAVRVQQKATGPKTRLVFAYPMSMTLIEGMFAPIVIDRIKTSVKCVSYADGLADTGQMTADARRSKYILETDFSAFDATIPEFMIRDCFDILRAGFLLNEFDELAWDTMVNYFINTPILMPDGNVYITHRGVPSGSWFTNIIDSMVNLLSIFYAQDRSGVEGYVRAHVLGDDAIIGTENPVDLKQWSRFASELGLCMSPDKSKVAVYSDHSRMNYTADVPYYLGRYWTEAGAWYRPIHITLARLLYHERYVPGDIKLLRLSRMAAHAMDNPMASVLILHLLTGDPSRRFHAYDTGRREIVTELYKEAQKLGFDVFTASNVTGLSELMSSSSDMYEAFTYSSYSRNTWNGRMVPVQV